MDIILKKIIAWAESERSIRAVILEGSRGTADPVDVESDYDINVFSDQTAEFLLDHQWLNFFDEVLIYQKESFVYEGVIIPSRLVYFENIPRIDFSFWPIRTLSRMNSQRMPQSYKNGYRVLMDKDGITRHLPDPSGKGYLLRKPGMDEFSETVYNFWFEMMSIMKYIRRGSIWYAKTIADGPVKQLLFTMILWNEGCECGWNRNDIHLDGKNLEEKMNDQILKRLSLCYSTFRKDETQKSVRETIRFFKSLSVKVARVLHFSLPSKKIDRIEKIILDNLITE